MSRDYEVYLDDIVESIGKIQKYTKGLNKDQFLKDGKTIDAVIRNLEVIGEAVKKLPPEIRKDKEYPDWKKVSGLRDILIHAYFEVDLEIIWDVVQNKVKRLKKRIDKMRKD